MLKMMFDSNASTKMIEFKYLMVNFLSHYNIILGRLDLNLLGEVLSILQLSLK